MAQSMIQRKRKVIATQGDGIGKPPPQAIDLEKAILGACMLDVTAFPRTTTLLKPESFYKEAHQLLYKAMNTLWNKRAPIDILTVSQQLRSSNELDLVGGSYYIAQLTNDIASSANIEFHSSVVADKYIKRQVIEKASCAIADAYADGDDTFDIVEELERGIRESITFSGAVDSSPASRMSAVSKILGESLDKGFRGISWGHESFDAFLGGLTPKLIFIGGRPGMGKTSLVLWIAHQVGKKDRVLFFSLEMGSTELGVREISMHSGIPYEQIEHVAYDGKLLVHLQTTAEKIARESKVEVVDDPSSSVALIRAKAKNMMSKTKIGLIVIDYLQLMKLEISFQSESKASAVGNITRDLKLLSKELQVPIIALSQLSRNVEARPNKRPLMSDLKESGSIEADSDIVLFPFREEYYDSEAVDDSGNSVRGRTEMIVAKNRGGKTGMFWMGSDITCSRYEFDPYKPYHKSTRYGVPDEVNGETEPF